MKRFAALFTVLCLLLSIFTPISLASEEPDDLLETIGEITEDVSEIEIQDNLSDIIPEDEKQDDLLSDILKDEKQDDLLSDILKDEKQDDLLGDIPEDEKQDDLLSDIPKDEKHNELSDIVENEDSASLFFTVFKTSFDSGTEIKLNVGDAALELEITAEATLNSEIIYQWYRDNPDAMTEEDRYLPISGATADTLIINTDAPFEAEIFATATAVASGFDPVSVCTEIVHLLVLDPQTVEAGLDETELSLSASIGAGESLLYCIGDEIPAIEISAEATDGAELSYQWYLIDCTQDQEVEALAISGANERRFKLSSGKEADIELYAIVTASLGEAIRTASTNHIRVTITEQQMSTALMAPLTLAAKDNAFGADILNLDAPISAYVSLSRGGQFIPDKNGKAIAHVAVTLQPGATLDSALSAIHESCYDGGAAAGYESSYSEQYGTSIVKLWGDTSGAFGYYHNGASAWNLDEKIENGDTVDAFIYEDQTNWSDAYTRFDKSSAAVSTGEAVELTLLKSGYDAQWNPIEEALPYTLITIDGEETENRTDKDGKVTLTFNSAGCYTVSAVSSDSLITAPVCVITVTGETVGDGSPKGSGDPLAKLNTLIVHTGTAPSKTTSLVRNDTDTGYDREGCLVFDPEVHYYRLLSVLDSETQLRFRAGSEKAVVAWNGGSKDITWKSGTSKFAGCISAGSNTVTLTASEAGKDDNIYTLMIDVLPTLSSLNAVNGSTEYHLDKAFASATAEYTLTIPETLQTMTLNATAKSENYLLKFDGGESNTIDVSSAEKESIIISLATGDGVENSYKINLNRAKTSGVYFSVLPAEASDARITVTDSKGIVIVPNSDGSYSLMTDSYEYSYTIAKYGYVTESGKVSENGGTINVTMRKNAENHFEDVGSDWSNFRNSETNMGITDAETPVDPDSTALLWNTKLGSDWSAAPSIQLIVDNALFCMSGFTLYKLNLDTGEIISQVKMKASSGYGYTPMTYADGLIFCPLSNGMIQAFNAKTLESVWVYQDALKGQVLSPIAYSDGYIYTGFWNGENKDANFVCVSVSDDGGSVKEATWSWKQLGGFYWAGALVIGNAVIVTTDDGTSGTAGDSSLYSFNKKTGDVISCIQLTGFGDARSSVSWDAGAGRVYFSTKGGYLCSAKLDSESGILSDLKYDGKNAQSTSTPLVYDGKVFYAVGSGISSSGSSGSFVVADAETLETLFTVDLMGYPQNSMLLSTAYEDSEGYLYFYSTYNAKPGGISMIKVKKGARDSKDAELIEIYDAKGFEQYCITSIICSSDGTLYYKNDSGNVFAVGTPTYGQVIKLIKNIGEVSEESVTDVETARAAYEALSDDDKPKVTNLPLLEDAENTIIKTAEDKISAIGEVTLESGSAIEAAVEFMDSLTDALKDKVTNSAVLAAAQTRLSELKIAEATRLIDAIPDNITSANKKAAQSAIDIAKAYYESLSEGEKAKVSNFADIAAAEAAVKKLNAGGTTKAVALGGASTKKYTTSEAVDNLVEAVDAMEKGEAGRTSWDEASEKSLLNAARAYNSLSEDEKLFVSNYDKLSDMQLSYGKYIQTDSETGTVVEGLPWHIRLVLRGLDAEKNICDGIDKAFDENGDVEHFFYVTLEDVLTCKTYLPDKPFTLKIPCAAVQEKNQSAIAIMLDADAKIKFIRSEESDKAPENELIVSENIEDTYISFETTQTDCWYGSVIINGSWDDLFNGSIVSFEDKAFLQMVNWLAMTASIVQSIL